MIEHHHLREFLTVYDDAWRDTDLWKIARGGREIDPSAVTAAYVRHLARPSTPREVFQQLLEEGKFDHAADLLRHTSFEEALGNDKVVEDLRALLADAHFDARVEVQVLWDELLRRANAAHVPLGGAAPEQAYLMASRDLPAALALFAPLARRIAAAEESRAIELRQMLAASTSENEAWRHSVEHALDRNAIDEAEALLEMGADRDAAIDDALPELPMGSPPLADAAELCRWSLSRTGGPARFYHIWDPLRDGDEAGPLIVALDQLATAVSPNADDVSAFLSELEALLGVRRDTRPLVRAVDGAFVATVQGLGDVASEVFRREGVEWWIPPKGAPIELPRRTDPAVLFTIDQGIETAGDYLLLTSADLFRCLSRPSDVRLNLLRTLSIQIPEKLIFSSDHPPKSWPADETEATPFADLHRLAKRVLDLHGFTANPGIVERIAFYAFGRPSLLHAILRALFVAMDVDGISREATVNAHLLSRAHHGESYRRKLRMSLLAPLEHNRDTHVVLAAALAVFATMTRSESSNPAIKESDVASWLTAESIDGATERIDAGLALLASRGIISRSNGAFRFSTRGGGYMVATMIGDCNSYWTAAKQRAAI